MPTLLADSVTATADYRRRARRIRASFSKAPLLRQQALVKLATERNTQIQATASKRADVISPGWRPQPPPMAAQATTAFRFSTEHRFADNAAMRLQTFGFTFSDRVALLDLAERQGITRFRANMMLALLEHQAPARNSAPAEVPSKSITPSLLLILGIEIAFVGVLVMLTAL